MPGSSTTPGRSDLAMARPKRVAFRARNSVGTRGLAFAARWLAYALPYRRFVAALADANARLGADVDRLPSKHWRHNDKHRPRAGTDVRKPLTERKDRLRGILSRHPLVRYSTHREQRGKAAFDKARRAGEEGIIAKRAASLYHSGKRTKEWLKIKAGHEQEAIIVGFTEPRGSRKHFGSLVLGVYDKGKLAYVGHSGGVFSREMLATLHARMMKLRTDKKPFMDVPHEGQTTWIKPRLVCQVKFTEWTREGEMRHPVFLGMRTDKPARQVRREGA
jgi:ATP-dependent DNA ligase